jgi:hypothetical protein
MRSDRLRWLIPIVVMAVALVVDVGFLHLCAASFFALFVCCAGGVSYWKRKSRKMALLLYVIAATGWGYALLDMTRVWGSDVALAKSVANAVRCYIRDVGKAPQKMEDLMPTYLREVPRTRSPAVGRIEYSLVNETDWCVGWNSGATCSNIGPKLECAASTSHESVDARR